MSRQQMILIPALLLLPALVTHAGTAATSTDAMAILPGTALGVDQLMKEPEKHPGVLVIEGVVKTVAKREQTLALIDLGEFRKCRVVSCSLLTLPVRWTGEMPGILDIVRVEGEIVTVGGKMLFTARKLEKAPEAKQP